jgi:peptidoglycan hydrolase CwlO-like protein
MNQTEKTNPFFDIDTYINHLEKTIEEQKDKIESLNSEIISLNEKIEFFLDH